MTGSPGTRRAAAPRGACCLVHLVMLLLPVPALAQAWVTPPGEAAITLAHEFVRSDEHLDLHGRGARELGSTSTHLAVLDAAYGLSERIALQGSVAWLAIKWTGQSDRHGPFDTGIYHGALQDARVAVSYQLVSGRFAVAPFVAFGTPTHGYQALGHAAFGRKLRELQAGISAGRTLRWPAGGYVHGSLAYSKSEKVDNVALGLDHVNGDFEAGADFGTRVAVKGFGSWQLMWDGLQLGRGIDLGDLKPIHDRLGRASYLQLGAGVSTPLTSKIELGVSAFATATGRNIHAVRALVTSLTWKLGGGFEIAGDGPAAAGTARDLSRSTAADGLRRRR